MFVIGHRGASGYAPENTAPAFQKAIELCADGIELDVHLTKDNKIAVNHNFAIDRNSNGVGLIQDKTLEELKAYDFGAWKGEEFTGTPILTLEEALTLVKNLQIINIEIKSGEIPYADLPQMVCDVIKKMDLTDKVIISSFNHSVAMQAKQYLPQIKTGLLYDKPIFNPARYAKKLGADAIHPMYSLLTKRQVKACMNLGIAVNVWTVDSPRNAKKLKDWGCNSVITNVPDVILAVMNHPMASRGVSSIPPCGARGAK